MSKQKYLTPEELSERYRNAVSVRTLNNWRAKGIGPKFVKVGKAVLYPVEAVELWDAKNTISPGR